MTNHWAQVAAIAGFPRNRARGIFGVLSRIPRSAIIDSRAHKEIGSTLDKRSEGAWRSYVRTFTKCLMRRRPPSLARSARG